MDRFFQVSRAELHNLYGPTEAAVDVTHWACRRDDARRVVPIGRPIANTRLYILDPALQTVPVGVAGELHIAGVQVAKGYLNRPELTAEKFIRDPFSADPAARMYKTGDLAHYLPDGNIEYLGRIDNQVKLRGFRIELGEIEAVFAGVDGVRAAVVVLREDTPGDARLVVYVVADSAHPPNAEALRAKVAEALPAYMVPSAFVFLDALPLTPSGKVDRKALPALARAAPRAADNDVAAAPGGELEQIMANIWCELLDVDEVRASDMFFDLGGHSLLSIKVVERFERETGVRIAPMDLLNQTLRQIVAGVEARCASSKMPLRPGRGGILTGQIGGRS
jgi:acyl-CoA synthetase (AMP-forming)/AMP-acid ligase II